MTTRKRLKRLVRARAAKTGESYTSALRHFREQPPKEHVMSPSPEGRASARCSFCGKFQDQVKRLIAGPGVFICDECVMLCIDIIAPGEGSAEPADHGRREAAPRPASPPLAPDVGAKVRTRRCPLLSGSAGGQLRPGGGRIRGSSEACRFH